MSEETGTSEEQSWYQATKDTLFGLDGKPLTNKIAASATTYVPEQKFKSPAEKKKAWRTTRSKVNTAPKTHKYPQDIGTDSQPNSIIFYINARAQSKVANSLEDAIKQSGDKEAVRQYQKSQNEKDEWYSQENRTKSEFANEVAAATGVASGTTFGPAASQVVTGGQGPIRTSIAAVGTGVTAAKVLTKSVEATSTVRLMDVIQLHIPTAQTSQYSAQWTETNLGIAGMAGSGRVSLSEILNNEAAGGGFLSGEARTMTARSVIQAAAAAPKALGVNADFTGAMEAATKKVSNPFKEQLFKSMGFRKFAFNYIFSPRNQQELTDIEEIIRLFKYHMHPERSQQDMFLIYPSEFNMEFMYKDEQNKHVHKISTCALADMKVTYGADGVFNTIKGTLGAPSEIAVQLAFTELETLDTERIDAGL